LSDISPIYEKYFGGFSEVILSFKNFRKTFIEAHNPTTNIRGRDDENPLIMAINPSIKVESEGKNGGHPALRGGDIIQVRT
jgi:hypothetical protein